MRKEIAMEWVEALPNYTQRQGALCKGDSFCCLGVLCELAVKHGVIPPRRLGRKGDVDYFEYAGKNGCLPTEVVAWAGMYDAGGTFRPEYGKPGKSLINLNDSGMSFKAIAEIIERDWELL